MSLEGPIHHAVTWMMRAEQNRLKGSIGRALLVAMLLLSLATPANASDSSDPVSLDELSEEDPTDFEAQPFVFNGEAIANPGWVVSITYSGSYACSGTLVDAQWVLTAAHCVDDADSTVRINVGSNRWFEGIQRQISAVHIHPGYSASDLTSVDLAMVRLSSPVSGVSLPKLVTSSSWPLIDQVLQVVGWGETSNNSPVPDNLQGAEVLVNSDRTGVRAGYPFCEDAAVAPSGYEDFCFGGDSWACRGDSGGPLLGRATPSATSGARDTIYGITSFGDPNCSTAFHDSVGQGIGPHLSWIQGFYVPAPGSPGPGDEMFFYRKDGLFRYYAVKPDGTLGRPILAGDNYTKNWDAITSVDLNGNGLDAMFFYRKDGLYRYYNIRPNGTLGSPILAGSNYTKSWDVITSVDLNGDGKDAMLFYRKDGLFRYYNVRADGTLESPILAGSNYTKGWDVITSVDLNGDGKDAMLFYRRDGLFRYYNIRPNATLGSPILAGSSYTKNWDAITSVDLNGNGLDAIFFYREDGLFRYYNIRPNATLGSPILAGSNYTKGWDSITAVELGG